MFSWINLLSKSSLTGWIRPRESYGQRYATPSMICSRTCSSTPSNANSSGLMRTGSIFSSPFSASINSIRTSPCDKIEEFLIDWIDMGYAPENYSQAQLDELDRLTELWVADHMRRSRIAKNGKRTRHS